MNKLLKFLLVALILVGIGYFLFIYPTTEKYDKQQITELEQNIEQTDKELDSTLNELNDVINELETLK